MLLRFDFFVLLVLIISGSVRADVLKPVQPSLSDYASLLSAAGYELFSFDISDLTDDGCSIEVIIREYSGDTIVSENLNKEFPAIFKNRMMLSQFSAEDQATMKPEKMYNAEKGIYKAAEKINIGFLPKADSRNGGKEICTQVELPHIGSRYFYLDLHPQYSPGKSEPLYVYATRKFDTIDWKENEFTPLVLLGSFWFDKEFNIFRFCGEENLTSDMSADILNYIPHYYVIGVKITKQSK